MTGHKLSSPPVPPRGSSLLTTSSRISFASMVQIELQPLPPATLHTNSYDDLRQAAPADRSGTTSPDRLSLNPGSQLSRVDGGQDAWVFLAAATAIEVLVWGEPTIQHVCAEERS